MWHRKDLLRSVVLSTAGAVATIALTISLNEHALSDALGGKHDLRPLVASFFAGAVAGFALDFAAKLMEELQSAVKHLDKKKLDIDEMVFDLLQRAQHHQGVMAKLLKQTIEDKSVARVGRPQYLGYLGDALKSSRKFQAIHRLPIRSFFEGASHASATAETSPAYVTAMAYNNYLKLVRLAPIQRARLFIIENKKAMEEDIDDKELLARYWQETGSVRSYWIEADQLRRLFPKYNDIPQSFVLFDGALLIKYDEELQTLDFDVVSDKAQALEKRLFDEYLTDEPIAEFREIPGRP